ncbi:MAG TPA: hypothetical protein VK507_18600, partial [Iamia sp.]|nr:hypothetical protein [Iamia sp.]
VDGEWTTVRIADIDADPDTVVADLREAGFTAERRALEVIRPVDGQGAGVVFAPAGEETADVVVGFGHSQDGGAHGLVGLSVSLPAGTELPAPPAGAPDHGGAEVEAEPVPSASSGGGVAVVEDDLTDSGVRFEDDGGVSLRSGTDATIVVYTER